MTRQFWALAAVGGLALAGCATDPTSSLQGTPTRIQASASLIQLNQGDSVLVTATTVDAQGVPLAVIPTASSATTDIVTVSEANQPPLSQARFYVKGGDAGVGTVNLSAGGANASLTVIVFPLEFAGAVTVNTAGRLDTVVVSSSAVLSFDSTAAEVFIDGGATKLISRSATELKVVALSRGALTGATVTVTNLVFLAGTENETDVAELDAAATVNISGEPDEPANDSRATATTVTSGSTTVGSVGTGDASDFFAFAVTNGQTIAITIAFTDGPDIDGLLYNPSGTVVAVAFTLNNPETINHTASATGNYAIEVNLYDGHGVTEPYYYDLTVTVS